MPQCQNNPGRRFRRCHAPLLLTVIMAVLFAAGSCRRRPQTVAPTGWLATSEPFDSLSRMLDLGFSGDMADDSLRIVCHRFDSAARRSADPMQLNRAAYWRGRMARREGRDSAERLEMQRALSGAPTEESDYLRRKIEWLDENPHDYDRMQWYDFLTQEVDYYRRRDDDVMLYGRYIELFNLMRDIGYSGQTEKYLALADSCAARISGYRPMRGSEINRALLLYGMGRGEEAARLLCRLREDPEVTANPDVPPLLDFNLYRIYGDTVRLQSAYDALSRTGQNPYNLYAEVLLHMAVMALDRNQPDLSADFLAESRRQGAGRREISDDYLLLLHTEARLQDSLGNYRRAARGYARYAAGVDSVRHALEDNELLNRETLQYMESVEHRHIEHSRRMERMIWIATTGCVLLVGLAIWLAVRIRRGLRLRRASQREICESERQRMALQIVTDRRGEALSDTRRQLEQMRRTADVTAEDVARLLEVLKRGELSEGQFASFRELVEKIRPEFVANLRSRCPRLGESALRVACYVYIGLDTKEIAQVMNVRPESVKQARWRLRKALSLPPEVDLRDALGEFDR